MTKVTYVPPNEPGYPASNPWNGIVFHANVPVDLDPKNRAHGYMVPIVRKWKDPATNRQLSEATEQWVSMIDIARNNPSFVVDGDTKPVARPRGRPPNPVNSEEYRAYALAWISAADDHSELAVRWNDEEVLRERCGVGDEDVSYLRPVFDAKYHELKRQAA